MEPQLCLTLRDIFPIVDRESKSFRDLSRIIATNTLENMDKPGTDLTASSFANAMVSKQIFSSGMRRVSRGTREFVSQIGNDLFLSDLDNLQRASLDSEIDPRIQEAVDHFLLFPVHIEGHTLLAFPIEYRFIDGFIPMGNSVLSLAHNLQNATRDHLRKRESQLGLRIQKGADPVIIKAAIFDATLRNALKYYKKLDPALGKIFRSVIEKNGVVSSDELREIVRENDSVLQKSSIVNNREMTSGEHESNIIMKLLERNLLSQYRDGYGEIIHCYSVPDEIFYAILAEETPVMTTVAGSSYPKPSEKFSFMLKLRSYLLLSYYLQLHGARRTMDKKARFLAYTSKEIDIMERFSRKNGLISGAATTYELTKNGISCLKDPTALFEKFLEYLSHKIVPDQNYGANNSETRYWEAIFDLVSGLGELIAIDDLQKIMSRHPAILNDYRNGFFRSFADRPYWSSYSMSGKEIRNRLLDPTNEETLMEIIEELEFFGFAKIYSENGGQRLLLGGGSLFDLGGDYRNVKSEMMTELESRKRTPLIQSDFEVICSVSDDFGFLEELIYGTEVERLSDITVFRITDGSLKFYMNNRGPLANFVKALERISHSKIPPNVNQLIDDIASHSDEVEVRECSGVLFARDRLTMERMQMTREIKDLEKFIVADNAIAIVNYEDFQKIQKSLGKAGFIYKVTKTSHVTPPKKRKLRYH